MQVKDEEKTKSRGWVLVFIQYGPSMVATLLCYDKGTVSYRKMKLKRKLGETGPSFGNVNSSKLLFVCLLDLSPSLSY